MIIKDGSHTPIYIQIAQNTRKTITDGHYRQDQQISTEDEIALQYGVSRMTARSAITELVKEGFIYRVHGKGAFVARKKIERSLNKITGFHEDMESAGLSPSSKIIKYVKRLPVDLECHKLNIKIMQYVFEIRRIRYVDGVPYGYQELIVPEYLVPNLSNLNLEEESLYSYLKKIQKPIFTAEQRMEAVMKEDINQLIEIPYKIPLFFFHRVSYLENNTPVELLNSYFRGDKFSYSIQLSD